MWARSRCGRLRSGRVAWERLFTSIRACGPDRSFISSDLGQVGNPAVEDGLALFADCLLGAGFTADEVHTMAVANTRRLARANAEARTAQVPER